MAELQTKFSIGDAVFVASTGTIRKRHDCPDCLGSTKWKATSPAGNDYEFACPRCAQTYMSERDLSLDYSQFAPSVRSLTIGSVRVNTHDDHPVTYMCLETGVGSGSVFNEADLFATHDEAVVAADAKAKGQNVTVEWVAKRYDRALKLCDYQLENAMLKIGRDERIAHSVQIGMLFDDLRMCETIDEVKDALEKFELKAAA